MPVNSTVPDFFQEDTADAQRAQVDWLIREVGLDDAFFANLVGTDQAAVSRWRQYAGLLPPGGEEVLRDFWGTVLHLLSFLNFDPSRVRELFRETMPAPAAGTRTALPPPWSGASLRSYLEGTRADGIAKVSSWVTGLRFGDPYAA